MTTAKINIDALANLTLGHGSGGKDRCLMEAVAFITGEKRSDRPVCVAPSLITMGIKLNDWATDDQLQTLKAFVPRVIGTAGDEHAEKKRKYLCIDAAVRDFAPLWLERANLSAWAERLRALPEITDAESAAAGRILALQAKKAAAAAAANAAYAAANAAYAAAYAANAANAAYARREMQTRIANYGLELLGELK